MLETFMLWGIGILFGGIALFAVMLFLVIFVVGAAEATVDKMFNRRG